LLRELQAKEASVKQINAELAELKEERARGSTQEGYMMRPIRRSASSLG
jgi:hypothetical protein